MPMEPTYDLHILDFAESSASQEPGQMKTCPGLQKFCPHYTSAVCDVKYSECVLLNSLKTSETLLRTERAKLLNEPTPQNLAFVAEINATLRDRNPDMHVDPAAILWHKRKGRLVAALFLALIGAAAVLIYLG